MARPKICKVFLTPIERDKLTRLVRTGRNLAWQVRRARVLLELDENQPPVATRLEIADKAGVSVTTVLNIANDYTRKGGNVDAVLTRKKADNPPIEPKLTGDVQARLIALACSPPPAGFARWSLRLLEKHVVLTEGIPPLDHSTIGRALKRGHYTLT